MYQMLGYSAFVGIACVPLSAPLSVWIARETYRELLEIMLDHIDGKRGVIRLGQEDGMRGLAQSRSFSWAIRSLKSVLIT